MNKCYDCDTDLTDENRSVEHIINNSIGGRLKSKDLLCIKCNSSFGSDLDVAISEAFSFFSNQIDVKRDRGEAPDVQGVETTTGEEMKISPQGKPYLAKPSVNVIKKDDGQTNYKIVARDKEELKKILAGVKKKHPEHADKIDEYVEKVQIQTRVPDELKFSLQVGGNEIFRAVTKMAINLYVYNKGVPDYIKERLFSVKSKNKVEYVYFYYPDQTVFATSESQISHSILVKSDENLLFSVVELFSCCQYLIILNSNYLGPVIDASYSFDLMEQKILANNVVYAPSIAEVERIIKDRPNPQAKVGEQIHRFGVIAQSQQRFNQEVESVVQGAFEKSLGKHDPNTTVTEEMVDELMAHLMPEIFKKFMKPKNEE